MSDATRRQPARQVADVIIQQVVHEQQAYYDDWVAAWTKKLASYYVYGPRLQAEQERAAVRTNLAHAT